MPHAFRVWCDVVACVGAVIFCALRGSAAGVAFRATAFSHSGLRVVVVRRFDLRNLFSETHRLNHSTMYECVAGIQVLDARRKNWRNNAKRAYLKTKLFQSTSSEA